MLAQVLWKQIVYQHKHHDRIERGKIPQGTIVFVVNIGDSQATIIYEDLILLISRNALFVLNSEEDIIPIEELQKRYHNNRATSCLVR